LRRGLSHGHGTVPLLGLVGREIGEPIGQDDQLTGGEALTIPIRPPPTAPVSTVVVSGSADAPANTWTGAVPLPVGVKAVILQVSVAVAPGGLTLTSCPTAASLP
jgi:hypothetical protein